MAGESKQIYQLTSGTFNGSSLVPFEVPNTDPSSSAEKPYITRKTTGDEVSEFVAKTQEFETDLETDNKTIIGAINELKEGGGGNANYVELTQAEYDLLTEEEKKNGKMYFITDGGSDAELPFYPSGEYSDLNTTDKHIVGAINELKNSFGDLIKVERVVDENITLGANASTSRNLVPPSGYSIIGLSSTYAGGTNEFSFLLDTPTRVHILNRINGERTRQVRVDVICLKN